MSNTEDVRLMRDILSTMHTDLTNLSFKGHHAQEVYNACAALQRTRNLISNLHSRLLMADEEITESKAE